MSIVDDLNSIRTHLEDDYEALEQLGISVENRNIENIKDMANQIYAKFPKTSYQEGTEVNLGVTLKGKLDYDNGVVGIGQSSQESTHGYQLIPYTLAALKTLNTDGTWDNNVYTYNGLTFTINEDMSITINGTATANMNFHLVNGGATTLASGDYTLSLVGKVTNIGIYLNKTYSDRITQVGAVDSFDTKTFSLSETTTQSRTYLYIIATTFNNVTLYPMIYSGTTTRSFEQYTGGQASPNPSYPQQIKCVTGEQTIYIKDENNNVITTHQLSLGDIELCGIGNYRDYIWTDRNTGKWYKKEVIGKKILNGSEYWISIKMANVYGYYFSANIKPNENVSSLTGSLCDSFTEVTPSQNWTTQVGNNNFTILNNNGWARFTKGEETNNLENFKNWLVNNNVILYYILATATDTEITDLTLINQLEAWYNAHSNNGTTIITSNGDLPMIIKVRGLKGE